MQVIRTLGIIVAAAAFAVAGPLYAQDKAKDKGKERAPVVKVLLDNDKVRIAEATFKPGDVSRNDRKARANYIVKGGKLERTTKDGKKIVYERVTGTSVWLEADSDVVKNIGKTTFVVVTMTPK